MPTAPLGVFRYVYSRDLKEDKVSVAGGENALEDVFNTLEDVIFSNLISSISSFVYLFYYNKKLGF